MLFFLSLLLLWCGTLLPNGYLNTYYYSLRYFHVFMRLCRVVLMLELTRLVSHAKSGVFFVLWVMYLFKFTDSNVSLGSLIFGFLSCFCALLAWIVINDACYSTKCLIFYFRASCAKHVNEIRKYLRAFCFCENVKCQIVVERKTEMVWILWKEYIFYAPKCEFSFLVRFLFFVFSFPFLWLLYCACVCMLDIHVVRIRTDECILLCDSF